MFTRTIAALSLAFCLVLPIAAGAQSLEARVAELEAKEDIRNLMKMYGRTLDVRDFEAFGNLFTEDGRYNGAVGPEAIGEMMRGVFADNSMGLREPNFHVFFNEVITVAEEGKAYAFSQSAYVVPSEDNAPEMVLFASYKDRFVKENGEWKFAERQVIGEIPARGE